MQFTITSTQYCQHSHKKIWSLAKLYIYSVTYEISLRVYMQKHVLEYVKYSCVVTTVVIKNYNLKKLNLFWYIRLSLYIVV